MLKKRSLENNKSYTLLYMYLISICDSELTLYVTSILEGIFEKKVLVGILRNLNLLAIS